MEYDNSWRALIDPGASREFFRPPPPAPLAPLADYALDNAWWLAELSRLAYRQDRPGRPPSRQQALAAVGLEERVFLEVGSTQCAIVGPRAAAAPFAVLVFRGTDGVRDWITNLQTALTGCASGGRVHRGFKRALDRVWHRLDGALDRLAGPLLYAGHSLGGALAILAASRRPPLAVYAYGAPRVGDREFAESLAGVPVYRVVNRRDSVPQSPPSVGPFQYRHAGEVVQIGLATAGAGGDGVPPLPGERRWFDPPPRLCDHAPVNYVACLEELARRGGHGAR